MRYNCPEGMARAGPTVRYARHAVFAVCEVWIFMNRFIYLDNAATVPVSAGARLAIEHALEEFGNPSSPHTAGSGARALLENAREQVAALARCAKDEIYFTASGTEANNIALFALAAKGRGKKIISTESEHPSVYNPLSELEKRGYRAVRISCPGGAFDYDAFARELDDDTALVSVMQASNETGAVYDIKKIRAVMTARRSRAFLHTDAVQSFGKLPPDKAADAVRYADTASFSAHKIGGIKGTGALYVRKGLSLSPLMFGGGQERALRPGTENLPGAAAFGAACGEIALPESRETLKRLYAHLTDRLGPIAVLHVPAEHVDSILLISLPGYRSETVVNWLSEHGICVSASSACSSKQKKNRALADFGLSGADADGALRIGLSRFNTESETDALAEAIETMKTEVRVHG